MNPWHYFLLWLYDRKQGKLNEGYDYEVATPELAANRFRQLFNLHGIETTEIPEIKEFENISLHDLNSNDRLLAKLTPDFLHKTAAYFGVRIEWLRSGEPTLYEHRHWYKDALPNFFEDLKEMNFEETYDPFCVITTQDKFDVHSTEYQPFILMLRKKIAEVGDKDVYKYQLESVWDWHHPPCRLQAKGLATKYYQLTRRMITIYKVDKDTFYKISEGYIPPEAGLHRSHEISFEEYGVVKLPHMVPYENFEQAAVLEEMKGYQIYNINYQYIDFQKQQEIEIKNPVENSKTGRKIDQRKLKLKERFLQQYHHDIQTNQISRSQAAKDFYEGLSPAEEKTLLRSAKDYDDLNDNKLEENIVRTIKDFYREYEKNLRITNNF